MSMASPHAALVVFLLLGLGFPLHSIQANVDSRAQLHDTVGGLPRFTMLQRSVGVSAMHMQLLHNDRVVLFDRTDFGRSNLSLPDGKCRHDPRDKVLKVDCTAHAVEYDVAANSFRPLMILTDTWCSSGTVAPDGSLVQTGGYNDGECVARVFRPCSDGKCDWLEKPGALAARRWYSTNHILPDGRAIIVGGRRQFTYELYPKSHASDRTLFDLALLQETRDGNDENNLYPFVHLNIDGNLFVFANNRAVLLDYKKHTVVRTYPTIPGGDPRNYPSCGSSVLLPLQPSPTEAEVLICGGAPKGSYAQAHRNNKFLRALDTCGRLKITDESPTWTIEKMPLPRVMSEMVLLPTGVVLIVNGAKNGTAGWECGREPIYTPVLYDTRAPVGSRFVEQQAKLNSPRLYHSSAVLLRDGRVLIGGSNPHVSYNFFGVEYPTELSLEAYSPSYLDSSVSSLRPRILTTTPLPVLLSYGKQFTMQFTVEGVRGQPTVTMVAPSFSTHSFSMNQRMLVLEVVSRDRTNASTAETMTGVHEVVAVAPASAVLAPPGYYMVFVVNRGVPSEGIWARIE